ncbi:unnamed protein product [Sympodiomycopsis kandeliae]
MSPEPTSPTSDETTQINSDDPRTKSKHEYTHGPPSLGYTINRKGLIISMATLVFLNACAPVLVYYLVKHFTNATNERLYGVTTAVLANSPITWPIRAWRLLRNNGERSPLPLDQSGAPSIQKPSSKWC